MFIVRYDEDSDVHMFNTIGGDYKCFCGNPKLKTAAEALRHLCHHELKGDKVPERAFVAICQHIIAELRREEKRKWGKITPDNTATNRGINHDTLGS